MIPSKQNLRSLVDTTKTYTVRTFYLAYFFVVSLICSCTVGLLQFSRKLRSRLELHPNTKVLETEIIFYLKNMI